MLGHQLVFVHETKGNRDYLRSLPARNKKSKPSKAQVEHKRKFYVRGTQYWQKVVKKDPDLLRAYTAVAVSPRNAYNMVMKDVMSLPVVSRFTMKMAKPGSHPVITIRATDVIGAMSVRVIIEDCEGKCLENGEAVRIKKTDDWKYTCTLLCSPVPEVIAKAVAYDFPGNTTVVSMAFSASNPKGTPLN